MSKIEEVYNSLEYHSAKSDESRTKFESLRRAAKEFAEAINANTPESREQSLAYTHLEETLMWAVKSVAIRD
jgi:hypothetical protein